MIEEELIALYKKTKKQLADLLEDLTFANFYRALQSGRRAFTLKNTQIVKSIDEEWIDAIEAAIPHIEAIVGNPRRYMRRETDVVPVEKARIVDSESVRHLASHTNLIHSAEGGEVRPNKILSAYHEESFDLYENRFVMTLITRLWQFVDRRYYLLGSGGTEFSSSAKVEGSFDQAGERTEYAVDITVHQGADYFDGGVRESVYEALFNIKKYVNGFKYSSFMKAMSAAAPVRPPIVKTNLLTKDPHYRACHKLWDFIESYDKAGYKIEVTDFTPQLDNGLIDDFDAINLLQYIAVKNKMTDYDARRRGMEKCARRVIKPHIEAFAPTTDEEADAFSALRGGSGLRASEKDRERAIKEAILRALRKERVKSSLLEQMRRQTEEETEAALKAALAAEKERAERERKERERLLGESIRAALDAQHKRERAEAAEQARLARRTERILRREVASYEQAERDRLEAERREEAERERLMSAILSDMLRVEEERRYIRVSPVVLYGRERMPVPVPAQRLPAPAELIAKYADMFTPPPRLSDEDFIALKKEAEEGRPRKRVSEKRVYDAIERALGEERKRRRREKAAADKRKEQESALPAAEAAMTEDALTDEEILGVLESARASLAGQSEEEVPEAVSEISAGAPGQESSGPGFYPPAGGDSAPAAGDNGDGGEADEVRKSFWRRLFELLFLWWKK